MSTPETIANIVATALVVRPGDTLILAPREPVTTEWIDEVITRIRECLPELAGAAVLDGMTTVAAYRPEPVDPGPVLGYVYRKPDGTEMVLDPADVTVVRAVSQETLDHLRGGA